MYHMTRAIYTSFLRQVYEYFPFCEIEFPKWNVAFTMHFDGFRLRISGNGQKVLEISVLCMYDKSVRNDTFVVASNKLRERRFILNIPLNLCQPDFSMSPRR